MRLTAKARNKLKPSSFVYPDERRYPIQDVNHARAALRFSSGTAQEATVRRAVQARYPGIEQNFRKASYDLTQ